MMLASQFSALLLVFVGSMLCCGCYPRLAYHHGKHDADFVAISQWMSQHGFQAKSWEKQYVIGSGTTAHHPDYQWYRGTYISKCTGNVLVSISAKDELQVDAFYDGCPDYKTVSEVALPDLVRGIERFYRGYKAP